MRSISDCRPCRKACVPEQNSWSMLARRLFAHIRGLTATPIDGLRTRVHGNLHLAKVMLAADDFLLTGFEGDTTLPLEERRQKESPLHDVASVLLSFQYAQTVALEHAILPRPELRERLEPEFAAVAAHLPLTPSCGAIGAA